MAAKPSSLKCCGSLVSLVHFLLAKQRSAAAFASVASLVKERKCKRIKTYLVCNKNATDEKICG